MIIISKQQYLHIQLVDLKKKIVFSGMARQKIYYDAHIDVFLISIIPILKWSLAIYASILYYCTLSLFRNKSTLFLFKTTILFYDFSRYRSFNEQTKANIPQITSLHRMVRPRVEMGIQISTRIRFFACRPPKSEYYLINDIDIAATYEILNNQLYCHHGYNNKIDYI